jgi:hypothetical protein
MHTSVRDEDSRLLTTLQGQECGSSPEWWNAGGGAFSTMATTRQRDSECLIHKSRSVSPLSKHVLAGHWEPAKTRLKLSELGAQLLLGRRASALDSTVAQWNWPTASGSASTD